MESKQLVQRWLNGRASANEDGQLEFNAPQQDGIASKFRRAYRWISSQSLFPGTLDMQWDVRQRIAHNGHVVSLAERESLSSFVLLPLLTLMTSRRMVFVGAPGHGKTSMATLMGLLAGYSPVEIHRAVQHGHPQLTISDLLGNPLPSDLVKAESMLQIQVAWRDWISMRVKIIDEYNRIPTKTQSALLSLMSEGYAEMFQQVIQTGQSAWFLTANDDLGGGTFPVIEALQDRIDVVVRCAPFHSRFLDRLALRIAESHAPEQHVPHDIVFSTAELDEADRLIRAVELPDAVLDVLGFFLGQLNFCRQASMEIDSMNKDTLRLSGRRVASVCNEDCPLDKQSHLCSQTEGGISPRTYQSVIHYSKALSFFCGRNSVTVEDLRQLMPWLLFDKVRVNRQSQFFDKAEHKVLLSDRAGWLRQMFEIAIRQHASYASIREPLRELESSLSTTSALDTVDLKNKLKLVSGQIKSLLEKHELNGAVHEDLLRLKMLHALAQRELNERC